MKKHLRFLAGSVAMATIGAGTAFAQTMETGTYTTNGPYVGLEGGGNFLNDVSPKGAGADANSHYANSYVGLGTLGYGFGNGLRAELEVGHRHNNIHAIAGASGVNGSVGMTTAMVNGFYDLDLTKYGVPTYGFVPHVGLGVGWAQPRFFNSGPYNGNTLSGKDNLFAYQGIVGVDYAVTPNIKINLDYHYFGTTRGTFNVTPGLAGVTSASSSFTDHEILLGARYEFNAPPPPPPEPPAPPPPAPAAAPAPAPEAQRSFQVFFDFNKSAITETAASIIQQAAQLAQHGQSVHIKVTGHTDTVGSVKYNQKLSEHRADAVKQALLADGLSDADIETLGVGKTDLLVPTPDGVREPQNRRATIDFVQ